MKSKHVAPAEPADNCTLVPGSVVTKCEIRVSAGGRDGERGGTRGGVVWLMMNDPVCIGGDACVRQDCRDPAHVPLFKQHNTEYTCLSCHVTYLLPLARFWSNINPPALICTNLACNKDSYAHPHTKVIHVGENLIFARKVQGHQMMSGTKFNHTLNNIVDAQNWVSVTIRK